MKQLFALGKRLWAACAESCIAHSGNMDVSSHFRPYCVH